MAAAADDGRIDGCGESTVSASPLGERCCGLSATSPWEGEDFSEAASLTFAQRDVAELLVTGAQF
jgi:hypothetical protein